MTRHAAPARPSYDLHGAAWRSSTRTSGGGNGNCVEVAGLHRAVWRSSTRTSSGGNGQCVEVACVHRAAWRSSTRTSGGGNGNCVEVALPGAELIAVRDSKLDTTGDFPHLAVTPADWRAFLTTIAR